MPTDRERLALETENRLTTLEADVKDIRRQLAAGGSWIRLTITGLITVLAAFAGAWAEHAARH